MLRKSLHFQGGCRGWREREREREKRREELELELELYSRSTMQQSLGKTYSDNIHPFCSFPQARFASSLPAPKSKFCTFPLSFSPDFCWHTRVSLHFHALHTHSLSLLQAHESSPPSNFTAHKTKRQQERGVVALGKGELEREVEKLTSCILSLCVYALSSRDCP